MEFEAGELMDQPFSNTPAASNQQITAIVIVYWCLLSEDANMNDQQAGQPPFKKELKLFLENLM